MTSVIALSDGSKAKARDGSSAVRAVDGNSKAKAINGGDSIKAVSLSSTVSATSAIAIVEVDIDLTNDTATQADVLYSKTYHSMNGFATGSMPNRGSASGTITTVSGAYTIQDGYHDGTGTVAINATDQALLIAENIKAGVTILGVEGTHEGGTVEAMTEEEVTAAVEEGWTGGGE